MNYTHSQGCGCSSCLPQNPIPSTSCFKPCPCQETPYPCDTELPEVALPVVQAVGCTSGCVELIKEECIKCNIQPFLQTISVVGVTASFTLNTIGYNLGANYSLWVNVNSGTPIAYGNKAYRVPVSGTITVPSNQNFTLMFLLTDTTDTNCDVQFNYSYVTP